MTQPFRLATGGRIDRGQPLGFRFDGQRLTGFAGDTLASALLANGIALVGRSFKYHRPRGVFAAGAEEPNALVTLDRGPGRITPNLRATTIELYEGLAAHSQNRFPSLRHDLGAMAGVAAPLLGAGFYYKTFRWPAGFWRRLYEPAIRRAAGLGRAPRTPDPDRYARQFAHCDVLVVGGGPTGLAAARAAAEAGARVILCDEQAAFGGSLLAETTATIDGMPAADWLDETLATLAPQVTLLSRTTAFGCYPDNLIGLVQRVTDHLADPPDGLPRERLWQVRASQVVLAAGAIQRPLLFPNNDRPGIMLADAGWTYLQRYGVAAGHHVVVATAEDGAYRTALALHAAGVRVVAMVDRRPTPPPELAAALRTAGIPLHAGTEITGTEGRRRIHSTKLSGEPRVVPCDALLVSGGWTPSVHLFAQAGGRLAFDAALQAPVPDIAPAGMQAAGGCAGTFGLAACLEAGHAAGEAAARGGGGARRGFAVTGLPALSPLMPEPPPAHPHPAVFVDLQNDVTTKDLAIATQEGFRSIEHVKRYTTAGMATDQGKTANLNTLATLASLRGESPAAIGLTTYRPPYTPVTFGALAGTARGPLFAPLRLPPTHGWAAAQGAVFEDVGPWRRARAFPAAGETLAQAVARECRAVRSAVGILDASTLGKIEVVGPDSGVFLDRLYTGRFSTLPPGQCRYALLLGEDGFVRDDGVIARLAQDRYHVTTTTGGAAGVLHLMEDYLQTEFPDLRVWLTSTTEQWGVVAVQGPAAAHLLAPLAEGIAIAAMPPMAVRENRIAGVPARVARVSFTGEPGFEVNVPAAHTGEVWQALLGAGATPYGTEAMHVLRAEMGFVLIGQETDGTVTPDDLGLAWAIAREKPDFVGKRSLTRADIRRADRKQLVGLLTADPALVLEEGAQLVADAAPRIPAAMLGHVTSAYHSATLDRSIALALVAGGRTRIGETLYVSMSGRTVPVTVTPPVFRGKKAAAAAPRALTDSESSNGSPPRSSTVMAELDPATPVGTDQAHAPSGPPLAPSGARPSPSSATPAPSRATPAPSGATPASSGARPAPSGTAPAPSGAAPAPSGTSPAPSGAPLAPSVMAGLDPATPIGTDHPDGTGQHDGTPAPAVARAPTVMAEPDPAISTSTAAVTDGPVEPGHDDGEAQPTDTQPLRTGRAHPLQALAAASPPCAHARLTALAPTTRLVVRADTAAATTIGRALGVLLGTAPHRVVVATDRAALWIGPDEWLVFAPEADHDLAARATRALGSLPGSVVDVSHRSVSIELAGPYAAWCVNGACPLDLDLAAFPPGTATRTVFGQAEIVLWRTDANAFHIEVARSFAPYVWECLEEARRELLAIPT